MCGIVGIINLKNKGVNSKELTSMQGAIKHRGPDGSGKYINGSVGIAMRRLSIIDVAGGDQPLYNEDKSISIVGNGEIYNYVELKKEVIKKGHKPRTGSDIELAIHLYEQDGVKAFQKFRGMFALAMHDSKKGKVFLVRDRIGEKPIYYTLVNDSVHFASEMKALIDVKGFKKELDYESINDYFHFYYIPEPKTTFKNVHKLEAGCYMEIDLKKGTFQTHKYWDPNVFKPTNPKHPVSDLKAIFEEAIDLTLRSDVPVGISLSGGIDSGSILAIAASKYKGNLKVFSVGYEGTPASDERKMARDLAKAYKVTYFEKEIKAREVVDHFPQLIWQCDDPIADIAAHSIYEVSKLAKKQNVKVLLNGAGGDEIFWGYPSTTEGLKGNLSTSLFKRMFNKNGYTYNNPNPDTTGKAIEMLYATDFKNKISKDSFKSHFEKYKYRSGMDTAKYTMDKLRDLWLKSDVVTLGDRMSMASSVELRSPYLDYKLIEYALKSKKMVAGYKLPLKYFQKEMFRGILPDELLDRPKKGFTPPVGQWINGIIKKYIHLLKNGFLVKEGVLDKTKLRFIHKLIKTVPSYTAYQLLLMEIWGRQFVYGENIK